MGKYSYCTIDELHPGTLWDMYTHFRGLNLELLAKYADAPADN